MMPASLFKNSGGNHSESENRMCLMKLIILMITQLEISKSIIKKRKIFKHHKHKAWKAF